MSGVVAAVLGGIALDRFERSVRGRTQLHLCWDELVFADRQRSHSERSMKLAFLVLLLFSTCVHAGWDQYRNLVRSDSKSAAPAPVKGVRITYFGTNGYLFESRGSTLLVDPYFSRIDLFSLMFDPSIEPVKARIEMGLAHLPRQIDAVLITHGHIDHLFDAPEIAEKTGARLIASPTSIYLANAVGFSRSRSMPVLAGAKRQIGAARVTVLPAAHDRVFGCCVPFPGTVQSMPPTPMRASQWLCGEPLAYLIEMGGERIYIDSGGTLEVLPPALTGRVDLAILGVALADSRHRLTPALQRLRPRLFLPSHQDDFFRPLDRGFVFNAMTDFPRVQREAKQFGVPIVLLDYFRPWTLR
jgi:L-ascorbate metabolism protein UlaG (beta-lactamase superfamily)